MKEFASMLKGIKREFKLENIDNISESKKVNNYQRYIVEDRDHFGSGHSMKNVFADQMRIFQMYIPDVSVTSDFDGSETQIDVGNGTQVSIIRHSGSGNVYVPAGEEYFNNYWKPGESRIVLIEGIQEFGSWVDFDPVELLNSGNITFKTATFNNADYDFEMENNTVEDTWSYSNELVTVELTKENNSYLYNMDLLEKYRFCYDEWNSEVFLDLK